MTAFAYLLTLAIPLWMTSALICVLGARWQFMVDAIAAATDRVNRLQIDLNFARNDQHRMEQLVSQTLGYVNRLEKDLNEHLGHAPSIDFRATATRNPVHAHNGEYVEISVRAHSTIMLDRGLRELASKYPEKWREEFYYAAQVAAKCAADDAMKQIAEGLTVREMLSREARMYERKWE